MPPVATATINVRTTRNHRNFEQLKRKVRSNSHRASYNYARAVVAEAKLRVPVRTGYLRSQIQWKRLAPGDFEVFVEGEKSTRTGAFYGIYVEYGTRYMAAQPYFTPAVMMKKAQWKADMKAVFR